MGKYVTEAVGTFFLVLTIGFTVTMGSAMAPLAIGSMLMAMVYMGAHVSGAHYNPAVSLGMAIQGALPMKELVPYWSSQIMGSVLAACTVRWVTGMTFAPAPGVDVGPLQMMAVEFLFSFALMLVILNVAVSKATAGNSYYGLAIGFTVGAGAWAVGPISGAAFNPAVATGTIVIDTFLGNGDLGHLGPYIVGTCAGAVVAVAGFRLQEGSAN